MNPLTLSKKLGGKIEVKSKIKLTKENLSILYTLGVAQVSKAIANLIKKPTAGKIIPSALNKRVVKVVAGVF